MDIGSAPSQPGNIRTSKRLCTVCGGNILWRRRLAANWGTVMYCSASCRRVSVVKAATAQNDCLEGYDHSAAKSVASAA